MRDQQDTITFQDLFAIPLRNGLTRPKSVRGQGTKMVNMGEIFAYSRISNIDMDRVPLSENEAVGYLLEPGDLLFARQSLVLSGAGKCSIILNQKEPATFESHIIRARLNRKLADPAFYYYLFNSPMGRQLIESIVEQVAAAGIRGSDLARLKVPYPSLTEQLAISSVLSTLDDKIELNRQMNETLEAIAEAYFKSWFIDLDLVHLEIEDSEPYEENAEATTLFQSLFENAETGELPRGWRMIPLDHIAEFLNGLALQKYPPESNEYLPVIKIAELRRGISESSDKASPNIDKQYVVEDGDVLFSWSGSLEVVIWCGGNGALNQHLFKVTSSKYPKWFYYQWIKYHLPEFQAIAAGKLTVRSFLRRF